MLPDTDRTRRNLGLALYLMGVLAGALQLLFFFVFHPLSEGRVELMGMMCLGAALAFPAAAVYLTVPRLLDRYDPEPWYALVGCLVWGALAACGFSVTMNSLAGELGRALGGHEVGEFVSTVVSAPLVEEFWKGLGVFGVFFFLRRDFDGVVDGIIYASFTAIGFAAVENVVYYADAIGEGSLGGTFLVRGVLAPWGHPVYTAMTGAGLGVAREARTRGVRFAAPLLGYAGAVFLHAMWNGSLFVLGRLGDERAALLLLTELVLWLLFVTAFFGVVLSLVRRRGQIIRRFLEDEVALGNLTAAEVELVASAFGLRRARRLHGALGVDFVRAAARLALSKWHSVRAESQGRQTVSMDFIVPLRQRLAELRGRLRQRAGR